jgi:hypothetical protein
MIGDAPIDGLSNAPTNLVPVGYMANVDEGDRKTGADTGHMHNNVALDAIVPSMRCVVQFHAD